ncbi:phospholipid carrier-dependent glycosyltransferase [Nocardioides sp. JQ2195]|uniref:dolichyl-phosphate-mannose--protein mannosyltransferase n=1 Tax=Nocardioides sp. JQ2195 TaxID=2592334 RepID=UPI00143EDEFA|nr:phospholipid carrier-dependent glycosyltransferase [Nocardioides sp. JQ2195]QIX28001.1 phospholipid carrier-dependent glycosyltransferase [Nocardioides sp. JQ2195]
MTTPRLPSVKERFRPLARLEDPLIGWLATLSVTALAFFLRVWKLGTPREFEFDETYYAKDAWSMLNHGYARNYVDDANDQVLAGTTHGIWDGDAPSMIVHPPVGKWMIALGEKAFGMDPYGWRIASAVVGALMILLMCRLVRRLTGSTLLGCVAGLLLCLDGMHLVLSRLALLDIFLAFWILAAVTALVADRDWTRERMVRMVEERGRSGWGPLKGMWFRPWRLVAGICFGLAIGTKWSALYPLAVFGILVWLWDAGARRALGVRGARLKSALVDGVPAFVHLVLVAFVVYVASWTGFLVHADRYEEAFSSSQYTRFVSMDDKCKETTDDSKKWSTADEPDAHGLGELTQSLRSLAWYHHDVYVFHTNFLNCSTHTYESDPAGWLVLNRPVGVNVENDIKPGDQGCTAAAGSSCLRQVILLGTPVLWWAGAVALIWALIAWVGKRDWRYGFALAGALSLWLPWELNDERPIFSFYASAAMPFIIVALTLALGEILGRERGPSRRRTIGTIITGSFVILVLLNFAWFWPIWTNGLLTRSEWLDRIWFQRWI